jgi:ankyrin repeat protein
MKYERKFFSAAREGDLKTIEQALADGFPVDHLSKIQLNRESLSVTPGRTGLMWATIEGQKEVVERLLAAGASPHARENTGLEAFCDEEDRFRDSWVMAAEFNRPAIMEVLLRTATRPTDQRLADCLEHAAQHGSLEVVQLLIREGIDINGTSFEGRTPLMAAASHGHPRVVEYLLEQGADVNLRGLQEIGTALNQCAFGLCSLVTTIKLRQSEVEGLTENDKLACLKLLLDAGADPNIEQAYVGYPLEQVAGNKEAIRLLLGAGANPRLTSSMELPLHDHSPDADPRERLMAAIEKNDPQAVSAALSEGADIDAEDEDGHTPIMYAAYVGNIDVVRLLVESGADLERWGQGDNVLNRAAFGGQREVFEYLAPLVSEEIRRSIDEQELPQGELRNQRSDAAVEALIKAVLFKPIEMVQAAIEDGVNVNGIGSNGETALHYAANSGKNDIVRLLLESGADANIRDVDDQIGLGSGATPLYLAASNFLSSVAVETFDLLFAAGADPNIPDDKGNTPLMKAVDVHSRFFSTVANAARLIKGGADLEMKNKDGNTALMIALKSDKDELVQLLREAGASGYGVQEVALSKAISAGNVAAVRQLLSKGDMDLNYATPLVTASALGHLDIVQALLEAGADVNQQNEVTGFTPLISAADNGHLEVLSFLLETGADVSIASGSAGNTALYYARCGKSGYERDKPWDEIIALLQ